MNEANTFKADFQSLSESQLDEWKRRGWIIIENLFPLSRIARAAEEVWLELPSPDRIASDGQIRARASGEFSGMANFPFRGLELCNIATDPAIMTVASQLLEAASVQLYQAQIWAKYAGVAKYEQTHHRDYAKNTAFGPRLANGRCEFIGMFVFLEDVSADNGPTAVVSREISGVYPLEPARFRYDEAPNLYDSEELAVGPAGSVLVFAGDVFHRATELTGIGATRRCLKLAVKDLCATWVSYYPGLRVGYEPEWSDFVRGASLDQLKLLGMQRNLHEYADEINLRYGVCAWMDVED